MTPENLETLDRLKSAYPGCVGVQTECGLIVVRRPTADEVIAVEDAIGTLTDIGGKLNPYAGLDILLSLIVHPAAAQAEELLQSYPDFFTQAAAMARNAATEGTMPRLEVVDLKNSELYQRELPPGENGQHPKRLGGRIFAVEHSYLEPDPDNAAKQRKIIVGRYLLRRFGLIEHREYVKEVAASGFLNAEGGRIPRATTLAKVARAHVVTAPGCDLPNWEKYPYLLIHLGIFVKEESRVKLDNSSGKR